MEIFAIIPLVFYVLFLGLNICLAIGVKADASRLEKDEKKLLFVGPNAWTIAALLVYWLIHHSTLAQKQ